MWKMSEFMTFLGWVYSLHCTDEEAFMAALAEADFTVVGWDAGKLDLCHQYGVKLMVYHGEMGFALEKTDRTFPDEWIRDYNALVSSVGPLTPELATQLSNHPALWGYMIHDEPPEAMFPEMAEYVEAFRQADPAHPPYINLTAAADYDSFIAIVRPAFLSYDYYQWWWGTNSHFSLLEGHRAAALAAKIPLFTWVEVNAGQAEWEADAVAPPDNANKVRQSVYTSLAYGVKAIQWFGAPMVFEPQGCQMRPYAKQIVPLINAEMKRLGSTLIRLQSLDVFHTPPIPESARELPTEYGVQTATPDLVLGIFKHEDDHEADYLVVANKKIDDRRQVTLQIRRPVVAAEKLDKQTGEWTALSVSESGDHQSVKFTLAPGDGELLRVQ